MATFSFFLILFSALFQAGWNFLTKSTKADKTTLLAVGWLFLGLALTPLSVFFFPIWEEQWWFYFAASSLLHTLYIFLLGWAYTIGQISIVFPIARGLGILFTSLISSVFFSEPLQKLGVVLILLGALTIGWESLRGKRDKEAVASLFAAVLVGMAISSYSLVDSQGAREIPPLVFIAMMNLGTGVLSVPILMLRKPQHVKEVFSRYKLQACAVSCAGAFAYSLVLFTFAIESTANVVALREISIVFAAALGVVFLKESLSASKLAAILCIVLGALAIKAL